jgi:hypothetical protein
MELLSKPLTRKGDYFSVVTKAQQTQFEFIALANLHLTRNDNLTSWHEEAS